MPAFIYRCPVTGQNVQGWIADDPSSDNAKANAKADANRVYEAVICTACTRIHLVNPKTGKLILGDDKE